MSKERTAPSAPAENEVAAFVQWFLSSDEKPLPERRQWLATCIKVTCDDRGLSTMDVSRALGRGDYYFYQLRRGYGTIDGEMAKKLMEFLGVGEGWLRGVRVTFEKRHRFRRTEAA